MVKNHNWKLRDIILALLSIALVLFVNGTIPFLMTPTLGQAVWTAGFAQSMANGSLFDFYAHDFGIPKPAAISFGLAGAWPTSLLIRLGLSAADAYSGMVAIWLGVAMCSAYKIACRFGSKRSIALLSAVTWMTMPIIWAHAGYSMLSLGMALLPFYFLVTFKLFLIGSDAEKISLSSIVLYVIATIVSVFMDGYTFMMFASGASILLIYSFFTLPNARQTLIRIGIPVHIVSFAAAYLLFSIYIGKSHFEAHPIDFFRGWGLDLSFLAIPTKGVLWIPDLLGLSLKRTNEFYFGDSSVWSTTFALPILLVGLTAWFRTKQRMKISIGFLLVAILGFYMALGPSIKINSVKPDSLQLSHPRQQSVLMASEYAIAPTGNAWISEKLPGFKVMRASYRWSALGIFALWLLIVIRVSTTDSKNVVTWFVLGVLILLNLPDYKGRWIEGRNYRTMFQQIDQEIIPELGKHIQPAETVAFIPWNNDFFANYLAPKVGFRTFNIGGDKNLLSAQQEWSQQMLSLGGKLNASKVPMLAKILIDGSADVIVVPYFHLLWSPHLWPCVEQTTVYLTELQKEKFNSIPGFVCPDERRDQLQNIISMLRTLPYVDVTDTSLFATIRLSPEFSSESNRAALLSNVLQSVNYPIVIGKEIKEASYILENGWHNLEAQHVWSKDTAKLVLPVPKDCAYQNCDVKLIFGVFGASPERPMDVLINSDESGWPWTKEIKVLSGEPIELNVPLAGATDLRSISISIPKATSPQLLIGSPDSRILGISLQRIELVTQ